MGLREFIAQLMHQNQHTDDPAWAGYDYGVGTPPFVGGSPRYPNMSAVMAQRPANAPLYEGDPEDTELPQQVDVTAPGPGMIPVQSAPITSPIPPQPDLYSRIRQLGQLYAPQPVSQVRFGPDTSFGQKHPKLGAFLDAVARQGAWMDPEGPSGREYSYLHDLAVQRAGQPLKEFQTGATLAQTLDQMRRAQTLEDQNTQLFPLKMDELRMSIERNRQLARRQSSLEVSPGATVIDPSTTPLPYTAPGRPPNAGAPARTSAVRQDPTSKTGWAEFVVGLDPETGKEVWAQRVGDAPKPSTGPNMEFRQLGSAIQLANSLKSHPAYTDMLDIDTGMRGVEVGLSQRNGFGDIAAINAFQRMIDPGATVREGDVALMQTAAAFLSKIFSTYPIDRLQKGDQLPEATRQQMLKAARQLHTVRAKNYNEMVGNQYRQLADRVGVPFEMIGRDFQVGAESPQPSSPSATSVPTTPSTPNNDPLGIR